ncbi:MAG: hypothetical protein KDC53_02250 [Saprospiraceae bacterium]|nr:hypothetical protein [Saprospiraceae bacterium]
MKHLTITILCLTWGITQAGTGTNLRTTSEWIAHIERTAHFVNFDTPLVEQTIKFPGYRYFDNEIYFRQQQRDNLDTYDLYLKQEQQTAEALKSKSYASGETIQLSLVFHFLHTTDLESIEKELTFQMEALNRDFGQLEVPEKDSRDPDDQYRSLAANPNIQFVLADISGGTGIAKVAESVATWDTFDDMKEVSRGSPPIDPDRYINIWVVKMGDYLSSYTSQPYTDKTLDGIVLEDIYFGHGKAEGYDQGKTLTHLMANYLGLNDLWGLSRCQDDGVSDTPIHNSPTWGAPGGHHISTCGPGPRAMTMNFMDNSLDAYLYMFTKGQVERLRYMLSPDGPRYHLTKN